MKESLIGRIVGVNGKVRRTRPGGGKVFFVQEEAIPGQESPFTG